MNISVFDLEVDSTSGTQMSSVSERLLKEIKVCLMLPTDYFVSWRWTLFWLLYFYLFFFFNIFFSQQSLVRKLQLREHGSSRSPAGTEQQSQDKQVPVLRLFSVWKALWSKLNSPPPFWGVHGKYIIWFSLTRFHLNTINLKKMWKTGYFSGFFCAYAAGDWPTQSETDAKLHLC